MCSLMVYLSICMVTGLYWIWAAVTLLLIIGLVLCMFYAASRQALVLLNGHNMFDTGVDTLTLAEQSFYHRLQQNRSRPQLQRAGAVTTNRNLLNHPNHLAIRWREPMLNMEQEVCSRRVGQASFLFNLAFSSKTATCLRNLMSFISIRRCPHNAILKSEFTSIL